MNCNCPPNVLTGAADFLGLFDAMKAEGHRVCIWDPPGIGYSSYVYPREIRNAKRNLINALTSLSLTTAKNATENFLLVGFEQGASLVRQVAAERPDLVWQLMLINPSGPQFYQRAVTTVLSHASPQWSPQAIDGLLQDHFMKEYSLVQILNAFAIPMGLTKLMIPRKVENLELTNFFNVLSL